jgi:ABC-type multidrug transport system fused ATPase/permease subunit
MMRELAKIRALKQLSWKVLSRADRVWLSTAILGQTVLSVFDAFGIVLVGALYMVTTSGDIQNFPLLDSINFLNQSNLLELQISLYVLIFLCLGIRSIGSLALNRVTLLKLSSLQSKLSTNLLRQIQLKDGAFLQSHSIQEISQLLTGSTNALFLGVIANSIIVVAEVILLVIYLIIFALISPSLAALTTFILFFTGFLSQRVLGSKSKNLLAKQIEQTVIARDTVNDAMLMLDENKVSGRESYFSDKFQSSFTEASKSYAKAVFTNLIPKFIFEIILVLTGLLVLFITTINSSQNERALLVIFLSASARLLPSVMKIQAGLMSIYASLGMSFGFGKFEKDLEFLGEPTQPVSPLFQIQGNVELSPFELEYKNSGFKVVVPKVVLERNQITYFFGPSGNGKSTIVKAFLGLLSKEDGVALKADQHQTIDFRINEYFDSIFYLSQKIHLLKGTIRTNITFESQANLVNSIRLEEAIKDSCLKDFLDSLPNGLDSKIAEVGSNVSGGQLQRLGLARAFYSQSKLLVLDEPTNAMDSKTEEMIMKNIAKRTTESTIVVISHQTKFIELCKRAYEVRNGNVSEHIKIGG